MYIPSVFAVDKTATLMALIEAYDFATLVSSTRDGLVASHLPFLLARDRGPKGTLLAHVARANPHGAVLDNTNVLVIFNGPHGYVSPSWYHQHPAVPTWNYAAVHVYGRARLIADDAQLRDLLNRLSERHEDGRANPWHMNSLPETYLARMIKGIIGFEIEIERLEGKLKLSQNRDAADRRTVISALAESQSAEDRALADFMTHHAAP